MVTGRFIAVALCVLVALPLPLIAHPTDAKLVGTWIEPVFDATVLRTYRADHTFVGSGYFHGDTTPTRLGSGTWRIAQGQLIMGIEGQETRQRIVSLTANELRLEEAPGTIYTYKRTSE